jgi:hypothetical protein
MNSADPYFPQPGKRATFSVVQTSIWGALILLAAVFLILDWPGLSILLVSTGGMFGYNFIAWLMFRGASPANNVFMGVSIVWVIILIAGVIFNNGHPCNEIGLILYGVTAAIVAGINALAYRKYLSQTSRGS